MDTALKQRLWGAAVLAALAIIFLPMLLKSPDVKTPDAAQVPLTMPTAPDGKFETRELPLVEPDAVPPPGGVVGMPSQPAADAPEVAEIAPAATVVAPPTVPVAAPEPAAVPAKPAAVPSKPVVTPSPAPVAPAPAPTSSPATAAGGYAVTVGSFSNLANANALVAKLRAARLPVMTDKVSINGGSAMRIRVGPFADRTAAEAARLRTDGVSGGSGKVVVLDAASPTTPATATVAAGAKALASAPPRTSATAPASGFAVQLAAPASESDALQLRDRARALGMACFVQRVDTDQGVRFRVRLGPVADRAAAEALRETANQKLGITGNVVTNP